MPSKPMGEEHTCDFDIYRSPGHKLAGLVAVVEGKAQPLQPPVEGVPDIIRYLLGNDLGEVPLAVAGESPQSTGDDDNHRRDDNGAALAHTEHGINTVTEHAGYDNAEHRADDNT